MSYTVLARKYRSRSFDDLVGQEPIATTLKNAITTGRIHHGYLFTGTRGVGKTSMARILAKALNCLKSTGPTTQPCGQCDSCTSIASGEDVDVIEIDAASNTGVDNIRELRSNAVYRPARARFKVYIIDEVHMLSTGAFNALLKTLEEPPEHVKFIMATTEPQKVPATIQSRVQRFDFRPIPVQAIADQLQRICDAENLQAEPAALRRIARLANGSLRDAVSLLDQLLSIGAQSLSLELLEQVLPRPGDEQICDLVDKLIAQDPAASLTVLDQVVSSGHALESLVLSLMEHLRGMMLLRVCGQRTELVDATESLRAKMVEQSKTFDEPTYVFMLTLLEELRRSVRYSGTGRALVEAAIVRLCMLDAFTSLASLTADPGAAGPSPAAARRPAVSPATRPYGSAQPAADQPRLLGASRASPASFGPEKKADSPSSAEATAAGDPVPPGGPSSRSSPTASPIGGPRLHPRNAPQNSDPPDPSAGRAAGAPPDHFSPSFSAPPTGRRPANAQPPTTGPGVVRTSEASPPGHPAPSPGLGAENTPRHPARGVGSDDIRKVTANPVVRRAVELFEGTLIGVRPANRVPAGPSAPDRSPDKGAPQDPSALADDEDTDE